MRARRFLPRRHALLSDLPQRVVPRMTVFPGNSIIARRHNQPGLPRDGNLLGTAGVISAIAVDLFNRAFDLLHQAFEH
ncbi:MULTISPECIES: hypothetical protein, partial [Methylococcus]|uniref:hypothetical protein n=1 Tax=Methylococcus TaxID=413 RepID=UPI001E32B42D